MIETCVHNDDNSAQCNDKRLGPEKENYQRLDLVNYICTNSDDYNTTYDYGSNLREDLIKCEAQVRSLKRRLRD